MDEERYRRRIERICKSTTAWKRYRRRIERICKSTTAWSRTELAVAHAENLLMALALRGRVRLMETVLSREKVVSDALEKQAERFLTLAEQAAAVAKVGIAKTAIAKESRVRGGKKAAASRPAASVKREIFGHWIDWQCGIALWKNKATFAREMQRRYPKVADPGTIENWCTTWQREKKAMEADGVPLGHLAMHFVIGREKPSR